MGRIASAVLVSLAALGFGGAFLRAAPAMRCVSIVGDWVPDPMPVAALQRAQARGRLITWFDWGEYAIWHLGPDLKVSIDGRRETIYSEDVIREQLALSVGDATAFAAIHRLNPEYVWLSAAYAGATKAWLVEHGYRIDVDTDRSFLAVRADVSRVRPVEIERTGCFPGP
jgi:hypothetical protein